MTDSLYVFLFLLVCASPVLLAVLIVKVRDKIPASQLGTAISETFRNLLRALATVVVLVLLIGLIPPTTIFFFPECAWAYALRYNTNTQHVLMESKPHDCDFLKAPIGNKYCHFDTTVNTEKVNGRVVVYVSWNKVSE